MDAEQVKTMKLGDVGRRILIAAAMESEPQIIAFIRGYFLGRLMRVTPEMLAGSIANNTHLWSTLPPGYRHFLQNIAKWKAAKATFAKYSAKMTPEELLKWMLDPNQGKPESKLSNQERSEAAHLRGLASIIINYPDDKGKKWLAKNAEEIKNQFITAMGGTATIAPLAKESTQSNHPAAVPRHSAPAN